MMINKYREKFPSEHKKIKRVFNSFQLFIVQKNARKPKIVI